MLGSAGMAIRTGRGLLGGFLSGCPRRRGIRILLYHGVVETKTDPVLERNQHTLEGFRSHMRYLKRFRVLGMDELLDAVDRPQAVPEKAAAVTFDDGFANNVAVAEVMSRLRLPWSVFVSTGEIGENRTMWLVEFSLLMLRGDTRRLELLGQQWPLATRQERERAFRELRSRLKSLPAGARREAMDAARSQFPSGESARLLAEFPSLRILNWSEIAELSNAGVEIGSHGVHHDMHHSGQPREERLRELSESRIEIEARVQRPCRTFAYPNGDHVAESPAEAQGAGYLAAFTTDPRTVAPDDSRFLLPRMTATEPLDRFVREHWFADSPPERPAAAAAAGVRS